MDTDKNIPNPQYFLMQEAYEQWAWKAYGISQVLQLYHINLQSHQSVLQNVRRLQLPPIGLGWSHFDLHCVSSDGWLDKTSNHIGGICVDLYIVELQGGTSTVATHMVLGEATISRATDIIQSSRMRLLKIFYTTSFYVFMFLPGYYSNKSFWYQQLGTIRKVWCLLWDILPEKPNGFARQWLSIVQHVIVLLC